MTVLPPPASSDLNLPALRFLDLSNNGLKRVPADAFRQMPGLQQLLLSGNALQSLETGRLLALVPGPGTTGLAVVSSLHRECVNTRCGVAWPGLLACPWPWVASNCLQCGGDNVNSQTRISVTQLRDLCM